MAIHLAYFRFEYNPASGKIFRDEREAGWRDKKCWRVKFKGKSYKRSRLAWFLTTGDWPKHQIDHIDGDPFNDRWSNLREATNAENCRNRKVKINNKLGLKGVHAVGSRFRAVIMKDGKKADLGCFKTAEAAKAAYDYAASVWHGQFARR